jgi:hypothetical protein
MAERIVEVEWEDSAQIGEWHHEEDVPPVGSIRSVGVVHRDDDDGLVLVQSMNHIDDHPGVRTAKLAASLVIPRSAIRKVRELKYAR